jgi:hypothetical protein
MRVSYIALARVGRRRRACPSRFAASPATPEAERVLRVESVRAISRHLPLALNLKHET